MDLSARDTCLRLIVLKNDFVFGSVIQGLHSLPQKTRTTEKPLDENGKAKKRKSVHV